MGPNFRKGSTRIGRERLPPGLVAILDQPKILRMAFEEMIGFVTGDESLEKGRAGVVFRVVTSGGTRRIECEREKNM